MPNQRSLDKTQISTWVNDREVLDELCQKSGKTRTEVMQEFIWKLGEKSKEAEALGKEIDHEAIISEIADELIKEADKQTL